jgi:hypothetical protein
MVSRSYDEFVDALPTVPFPAWELLERIVADLQQVRPGIPLGYSAKVGSTNLEAADAESLKDEIAAAPWPVDEIGFLAIDPNSIEEFSLFIRRHQPAYGRVISSDRAFVDHFRARVEDWFAAFASDPSQRVERIPEGESLVLSLGETKDSVSQWKQWSDPVIVTAAGTIVLVLLGLVTLLILLR